MRFFRGCSVASTGTVERIRLVHYRSETTRNGTKPNGTIRRPHDSRNPSLPPPFLRNEKNENEKSHRGLRGISFFVEPGTTTALVGHTGAGKTTISRLLFRFYDPVKGVVSNYGEDLYRQPLAGCSTGLRTPSRAWWAKADEEAGHARRPSRPVVGGVDVCCERRAVVCW